MAIQSRPSRIPPILLTRPAVQADRFARALRNRFGAKARIVISPVSEPKFLQATLPDAHFAGLIFTSETGVAAYRRLEMAPTLPTWCVGDETAKAARLAGLEALSAGRDSLALASAILKAGVTGPLLHLRGREVASDLSGNLTPFGVQVADFIVYEQIALPLNAEAGALLQTSEEIVIPVFSARSADRLADAIEAAKSVAPLWVAAISPVVAVAAAQLRPARVAIAHDPDAAAMLDAIAGLIVADTQP